MPPAPGLRKGGEETLHHQVSPGSSPPGTLMIKAQVNNVDAAWKVKHILQN